MTDEEKIRFENFFLIVLQLLRDITPYAAKHGINKCYCPSCNQLRLTLSLAAKMVEHEQPPVL